MYYVYSLWHCDNDYWINCISTDDPYPFIRVYGYLATLWAIVAITCFICGWLEKEEEV